MHAAGASGVGCQGLLSEAGLCRIWKKNKKRKGREGGFILEDKKLFVEQFINGLKQNKDWNLTADDITFYEDGFTAADGDQGALIFIRDTNIRYHKTESDTLIGSYVVIRTGNDDAYQNVCRFEVNYLYETYQKQGWDNIWKIVSQNLHAVHTLRSSDVFSVLDNYEAMKQHLIIRPINFNDHRFELKDHIYRRVGDIALVLYMIICDNKEMGLNTSKVPKLAYDKWGIDYDQIFEDALMNTYVLAPPRMYMTPMDACNPPYSKGAFMALGSGMKKIHPLQVPTITTTKQTNGAIAMFYPGVKEKIAEMAGGNFYVAFTSIHDVKIHCDKSISPRDILDTLRSVNNHFDPAEILSRKVFYYRADTKDFSVLEL